MQRMLMRVGHRKRARQPQSSPRRTKPQQPGRAAHARRAATGTVAAAAGGERTNATLPVLRSASWAAYISESSGPFLHACSRT